MSRLIHHGDMSAAEIVQCSYDALAIVGLCQRVASDFSATDGDAHLAIGDIAICLTLADKLMVAVHDALESHEGIVEAARRKSTG
ncbi:MAG: hypothetical protein ABTQ31_16950 [Rhizobiaceae bacterium]